MYGILFRVLAKPGKLEELSSFLEDDGKKSIEKEPGTFRFEVYRDPENENALYVYEAYRDEEAFEQHQKSELYQQWESLQPRLVARFEGLFKDTTVWPTNESLTSEGMYNAKR